MIKPKRVIRTFVILLILISNVGCDQITKNIIRQRIDDNEQIDLMGNFLTLTRVENSGAFLSIGNSLSRPLKIILLTVLPIVLLGVVLGFALIKKDTTDITLLGICFITGGGIGNIYDRLVHGSVTDFLHMDFVIFQTGIFNMADISIMTGFLIVLLESYVSWKKARFNGPEKPAR
ncbi:MAG: signal peptidase II [Marivirga sp.]|nr:signal peptidase II [Marivirga sp.]